MATFILVLYCVATFCWGYLAHRLVYGKWERGSAVEITLTFVVFGVSFLGVILLGDLQLFYHENSAVELLAPLGLILVGFGARPLLYRWMRAEGKCG